MSDKGVTELSAQQRACASLTLCFLLDCRGIFYVHDHWGTISNKGVIWRIC